jgi:putative ABC transport system ATP-binding protein
VAAAACPSEYGFDIVTIQKIVAQLLLDGLTVLLTIGLGMIVLAFYHPWLLAFDVVLLLMLAVNVFVLGRGAVQTSIRESRSKYAVAGWLEEIARCPATFKGNGGAEFALNRIDRLTTDYLSARLAHFRVLSRQIICGLALEAFASAILLGLGGFLVIQGQMTLGQLVAAELIVTLIVAAVAKFDKHLEGAYDLLTSMDKLGHLFDLPVESSSGIMNIGHQGAAALSVRDLAHVWSDGSPGLRNISFDLRPGELTAVTGRSGSGKSTLFRLLFRIYEPSSGRILLDGLDLEDLRMDVMRDSVALVHGTEIFEGTIAENVHLSRPEVTAADVRQALLQAGLAEPAGCEERSPESLQLSRNLSTRLAYDGRPLSESQARRLVLARALAGKPRLLLIDGTLDQLAEDDAARIVSELRKLHGTCTVLVATAHRTIADLCDRTISLS